MKNPRRRPVLQRVACVAAALILSACANVSNIASGEAVVKNRLAVTVDSPWNQFERGISDNTPTWTMEGITVDALQFYVGLKDGELIAPTPSEPKGVHPLAFKSGMQPAEIVGLYQSLLTRDGSTFTLDKLEPQAFLDGPGFRFEYSLVRKTDDVRLRGMAFGAVRGGQLFVINYSAPRLGFFPRYRARVEALAKSARLRS